MTRLRETLNPEESQTALREPTRTRTPEHQHSLWCGVCHEVFYVDQSVYREFMRAVEYEPSDNPFVCERCLEAEAEEEYARG
jgi:hypothetical protein